MGFGAASFCALAFAFAIAQSASAVVIGHTFDFQFGAAGTDAGQFAADTGMGIAIDQSAGHLYVADSGNSRVQKFDTEGNFLLTWGYGVQDDGNELQVCTAPGPCQAGKPGVAPGQLGRPSSIAVDNSGGPNDGAVYVADTQRHEILKFSPNGSYLGKINGAGSPEGVFTGLLSSQAVDVDGQGFVWVLDGPRILRFSNQPNNAYVGGSQLIPTIVGSEGDVDEIKPHTLAVEPSGANVYLTSSVRVPLTTLYRLSASGASLRRIIPLPGSIFPSDGQDADIGIDPSTGHIYIGNSDIQEFDDTVIPISVGPPFGESSSEIDTVGVYSATDTVYVGTFGNQVVAFKPRHVAEATTEAASEVHHTTATINGRTAPDPLEGGDVSDCYFQWGLTTSYENQTPCEPEAPLASLTDVSADLSGLIMEETYHYRLVTENSIDTNFGEDRTFVPRAVLATSTDEATEITASTATLNASFDPNGEQTDYRFEYGVGKDNLDLETPLQDGGSTAGLASVSEGVGGLEDYTTYFYRVAATNSLGTSLGPIKSFRTEVPDLPGVGGAASSKVTATSADLSALITPNYGETLYGFEYGETPAYGTQVIGESPLPGDDQGHTVQLAIDGLIPGRTYHFRAIAINFGGIAYGPNVTFATLDVPKVLTSNTSSITQSTARLNSLINPSLSPTTVHFEYGPSGAYGSSTQSTPIGSGSSAQSVGVEIGGLAPATTYHFRAIAQNAIGVATGPNQIFTTAPAANASEAAMPTKKCKRGFFKRRGKCVKRKPRKRAKRAAHRGSIGEAR
jgi:hypothetical protein